MTLRNWRDAASLAALAAVLPAQAWAGTPEGSAVAASAASGSALVAGSAGAEGAETSGGPPDTVIVIGEGRSAGEIPGSAVTISQADLVRARVFTVNEALRQAPGVFARDEEGLGLRPNIGIRGLNPTRSSKVLSLEDGLPLAYAPYGDNASYAYPPVRRFARIEVLKGASQIRFGPGTIGGVVNFVTPAAYREPTFRAMLAGGTRGYGEVDVSTGTEVMDWGTLLHVNATRFSGVRDNTDLQVSDIYFKAERIFGEHHALTLRLGRSTEDSQVTYSGLTLAEWLADPRGNIFANDRFTIRRVTGSATWGWELSDSMTLTTSAHYQWFDRDWWRQSSNSAQRPNDSSDPACGGLANLNTTCGNEGRLREYHTYGLETRLSFETEVAGARVTGETGLRYMDEVQRRLQVNADTPRGRTPGTGPNGGTVENNLRYAQAWSAFATASIEIGRFSILPGVRFEDIAYQRVNRVPTVPVRGETSLQEVIPGLGLRYDVSDAMTLYAGIHRGFAPPLVSDVINNSTGGSIDLDPELSTNIELGVRGTITPGLDYDLALFRMDFENQVVPASVAGGVGATLTTAGETLHRGMEASLRGSLREMDILEDNDLFFRVALTWLPEASYQGARFSSVSGFANVSVTGNRLPYSAEFLSTIAVGWAIGESFEIQLEHVHVGRMYGDDLNTVASSANGQRGELPAHDLLNLTMNIMPEGAPFGFFATVKNLTDELYIADRSRGMLPGTPRLFQAGVTVDF